MNNQPFNKTLVVFFLGAVFSFVMSGTAISSGSGSVASVMLEPDAVFFEPAVDNNGFTLCVNGPESYAYSRQFQAGETPYFGLSDNFGEKFPDGACTYELTAVPVVNEEMQKTLDEYRNWQESGDAASFESVAADSLVQIGSFYIQDGRILLTAPEKDSTSNDSDEQGISAKDQVIYDDLIVDGSECLGWDCANGESFGYDTLILKENNLRILFNDTSSTSSYPTNDWRITANDSSNGGGSYFSIDDVDGGNAVFKIEAGAPANSLYVEDYGRVGLGTSSPYVELHIKDGDTPTVRLDQDSSSGFAAQMWDMAGNETNFFIRDVTNGSKLPFRIQPGTPTSTLCLGDDGYVGIGTWGPSEPLELVTTGEDARIVCERTDGATGLLSGGSSYVFLGAITNHPFRFISDGSWRMQLNTDNSLEMRSGAECTSGGVWADSSSESLKENIRDLSLSEAEEALMKLAPVKYYYESEKEEEYLGFIAEEVPDLVAFNDRAHMSAMDVVAVLTKVVQEQQNDIEKKQAEIDEQQKKIEELASRIAAVEKVLGN